MKTLLIAMYLKKIEDIENNNKNSTVFVIG